MRYCIRTLVNSIQADRGTCRLYGYIHTSLHSHPIQVAMVESRRSTRNSAERQGDFLKDAIDAARVGDRVLPM